MSVRIGRVVMCDFPDCEDEFIGGAWPWATTQRDDARGNHWGVRKVGRRLLDLCPDHKEAELPS